jgi:protein-arginine kinase activator protein McsA
MKKGADGLTAEQAADLLFRRRVHEQINRFANLLSQCNEEQAALIRDKIARLEAILQ